MPVKSASAIWEGTLRNGKGIMKLESGAYQGHYSFGTRFTNMHGTNPEELIGAALAGCFSMQLSLNIEGAGFKPEAIKTETMVHLDQDSKAFTITHIDISAEVQVQNMSEAQLKAVAEEAKTSCPVSRALGNVPKNLKVTLV